jgi:hypothetical protein
VTWDDLQMHVLMQLSMLRGAVDVPHDVQGCADRYLYMWQQWSNLQMLNAMWQVSVIALYSLHANHGSAICHLNYPSKP